MTLRRTLMAMLVCGALVGFAVKAAAQSPTTFGQPGMPYRGYPSSPTVSPYLNLVNNPNSNVTNYQTLVRPMMEEREALHRQNMGPQGNPRSQPATSRRGSQQQEGPVQAARFLNYSHYYGTLRR